LLRPPGCLYLPISTASSHGITLRSVLSTSSASSSAYAQQTLPLLTPLSSTRGISVGSTKLHAASVSGTDALYNAPTGGSDDGNGGSTGDKGTGTATVPQEIFNLVKGIVGAGVLTLPAGIASFGNAPSAAIPAVALICFIGTLSAYGFAHWSRLQSTVPPTSATRGVRVSARKRGSRWSRRSRRRASRVQYFEIPFQSRRDGGLRNQASHADCVTGVCRRLFVEGFEFVRASLALVWSIPLPPWAFAICKAYVVPTVCADLPQAMRRKYWYAGGILPRVSAC
jgi:hypothetical protein